MDDTDDNMDEAYRARAAELLDKHALVGLTYLSNDETVARHEQVHGTIVRVDAHVIALRLPGSDEEFTLPPDPDAFEPAPPGTYRLHSTGEVVVNPDLLARWTIKAPPDDPWRFLRDSVPPAESEQL